MKTATALTILAAFCVAANSAMAYKFLFTAHESGVVAIADDKGKIHRARSADHPQRADVSKDGKRVFISELNGAKMVDIATKKVLWRYKCPAVRWDGVESGIIKKGMRLQLQNPVAQILDKDRFLVGNEGIASLLEINSRGDVLKTVKSESLNRVNHGEFRLASKTDKGEYIFPLLSSSLLTIYDKDGKQVRRIKTPDGVVSASYLKDGNLLTGGIFGVAIYDLADKIVWSFTSKELQKALKTAEPVIICDVKPLPNGNYLCTTYGDKRVPDVLEISPKKEIVKKIDFKKYSYFSALQLL